MYQRLQGSFVCIFDISLGAVWSRSSEKQIIQQYDGSHFFLINEVGIVYIRSVHPINTLFWHQIQLNVWLVVAYI